MPRQREGSLRPVSSCIENTRLALFLPWVLTPGCLAHLLQEVNRSKVPSRTAARRSQAVLRRGKEVQRPVDGKLLSGGLILLVALIFGTADAVAQASAEYAGATSAITTAGAGSKAGKKISFPTSTKKNARFLHLPSGVSESPADANRRALEEKAGDDAGTLLLRSTPSGARVWIDEKLVGETPLMLVLAPGTYEVEIRGKRMGVKKSKIELLTDEKREIVLSLASRYPSQLRLE